MEGGRDGSNDGDDSAWHVLEGQAGSDSLRLGGIAAGSCSQHGQEGHCCHAHEQGDGLGAVRPPS